MQLNLKNNLKDTSPANNRRTCIKSAMFFKVLKKYKNDIILIIVMIALSVSSWFIIDAVKTEGGSVIVMIDGKESAKYALNEDSEITIKNGENINNLIIEDGVAKIIEASCPDKLCVKQHSIAYNGETITCLPNKVVVKIISETAPETDFTS